MNRACVYRLAIFQCAQASIGLELFSRMILENIEEDRVLMVTVIDACADMGLLREAKSVHCRILRRWAETGELMGEFTHCNVHQLS